MKRSKDPNAPLCTLYEKGTCPFTVEDVKKGNISYHDMKKANIECCKTHRDPTDEEIEKMYGGRKNAD